ncbi:hypothetical protein [Amycolatopsis antarctica]|nr:hypothetical protein [Amycolatopsis antarctica]
MDDNYRLIKLISLLGWKHLSERKHGPRYSADADGAVFARPV